MGEEFTTARRQARRDCIEPKHGVEASATREVVDSCWQS